MTPHQSNPHINGALKPSTHKLEIIGDIQINLSWPGWPHAFMDACPTNRMNQPPAMGPIPARVFKVWFVLSMYANKEGVAWPSLNTLCRMSGFDRSRIAKILTEGEGICWARCRSKGRKTTRYFVKQLPNCSTHDTPTVSPAPPSTVAPVPQLTVSPAPHRSIQGSNPLEEPIEEKQRQHKTSTHSYKLESAIRPDTATAPDYHALEIFLGRRALSHETTKIFRFRTQLESNPVVVDDKPIEPSEFIAATFKVMPLDMKTTGWNAYMSRVIDICREENRLPISMNGKTNVSKEQRRSQQNEGRYTGDNLKPNII